MKANWLRVLRAERDITQLDLARELGWNVNLLWRIEHGYREATPAQQQALVGFFGTTVDAQPAGLKTLRVLRAERDITQLDLAHQLGWSPKRMRSIDAGVRPTSAEQQVLAAFFGTTVDAIWPQADPVPHTPGDWAIDPRCSTRVFQQGNVNRGICSTGGYTNNREENVLEENEANARVIVRLPQMFTLLRKLAASARWDAPCHRGLRPQSECPYCCESLEAQALLSEIDGGG